MTEIIIIIFVNFMKTQDKTVERNYISKHLFLFEEYKRVKTKSHRDFRFLKEFYASHCLKRQVFLTFYNRYQQDHSWEAIIPQKRGPKWSTRRPSRSIEEKVIRERERGNNKYEIHSILKPLLKNLTPSPSGIYNICRRYNLNRLQPKMREVKRKIIKTRAGELGHIDAHHLSKGTITSDNKRYYIVAIVDSFSRIAWAEVCDSLKCIEVMFAAMRCFYRIQDQFGINFDEILSDNGVEFSGKRGNTREENLLNHPFERLLSEMRIKHRYTRPYRPQTNGKVERFWRTREEDLIQGTYFESLDHLKSDLQEYLLYYNYERPHQGINGVDPVNFLKNLSAN